MRHFEKAWPDFVRSVLEPNEAKGYRFTVAISTSADLACSPTAPRWKSRKCENKVDNSTAEAYIQQILNLTSPRDVTLVDIRDVCSPAYGAPGQLNTEQSAGGGGGSGGGAPLEQQDVGAGDAVPWLLDELDYERGIGCAPWFRRVHMLLEKYSGEHFDKVIATRPDVKIVLGDVSVNPFQHRSWFFEPGTLRIDDICNASQHQGFHVFTPVWKVKGRAALHERDMDFLHVLCNGEKMSAWENATTSLTGCNDRSKRMPQHPESFKGTKEWNSQSLFCHFVQTMEENAVPMQNDEAKLMLDWVA